jgi:hypothetical protein
MKLSHVNISPLVTKGVVSVMKLFLSKRIYSDYYFFYNKHFCVFYSDRFLTFKAICSRAWNRPKKP